MAYLFFHIDDQGDHPDHVWAAQHIKAKNGTRYGLGGDTNPPVPVLDSGQDRGIFPARVRCCHRSGQPRATWLLFGNLAEVLINGTQTTGIHMLSHRDEIRLRGGRRIFFSKEEPPRIERLSRDQNGREIICPRCRQPLSEGSSAVCCPACRAWHHEMDGLNCWTYAECCSLCDQSTDLGGDLQWNPGEL